MTRVGRVVILLRNLNLGLLLHLNLHVSDRGWHLTIDDKVGWRRRALPDFVLADNLDAPLVIRATPSSYSSKGPHQRRWLLVLTLIQELRLLRGVHGSRHVLRHTGERHLRPIEVIVTLLLLRKVVVVMRDRTAPMVGRCRS